MNNNPFNGDSFVRNAIIDGLNDDCDALRPEMMFYFFNCLKLKTEKKINNDKS